MLVHRFGNEIYLFQLCVALHLSHPRGRNVPTQLVPKASRRVHIVHTWGLQTWKTTTTQTSIAAGFLGMLTVQNVKRHFRAIWSHYYGCLMCCGVLFLRNPFPDPNVFLAPPESVPMCVRLGYRSVPLCMQVNWVWDSVLKCLRQLV